MASVMACRCQLKHPVVLNLGLIKVVFLQLILSQDDAGI